jgi:non-ribosomal peptide synthetase component F/acyl carrier protein
MEIYEFPTSYGQRRMWLLSRLDPDQPTYNIGWALWLDGELDSDALEAAWQAALLRHEALRTSFRDEGGVPVQVIADEPVEPSLRRRSVEQLPAAEREAAVRSLIGELARQPIDPHVLPLVRAELIRISERRHLLAVIVHHIAADGWSFRILFSELAADYAAIRAGAGPVTEEPPIQYADFALWQLEHAEQGGFAQAERFWRSALAGAPGVLPLPTEHGYPARQVFDAAGLNLPIDADLAAALRRVAAERGSTLFAVLLAAYALVLARLTGEPEVLIAVPMAARTRPETESVVGLFMNTVPIRIAVDERRTAAELISSTHAAVVQALAQQELPFARMVELARPDRDPGRLPLVQVMFAYEESWAMPDSGGLSWRPELMDNGTAKFELELTVTDSAAGPGVRVNYNTALFSADTGRLVADGFERALRALAGPVDRPVAEAQLMSPELLRRLTRDWPVGGPAVEVTAVSLLRQACAGDAVLVEGSDGCLTGNQLRRRAAGIAAALRSHGIGRDDRVAILLPRGARLLPAVLAVWSLGAAYLPLDPIYPAQRLAGMLADAGARAILLDSSAPDAPGVPAGAPELAVVDLAEVTDADELPDPQSPPAAAAYTMFTSGSTGRPKAVTVTQGGVGALLSAVAPLLALGPDDRLVAISTFTFDIALVELLAPVLAGARTVVADTEHSLDAALLRQLLADRGATALQATPATWRMLVEAGGVPAEVRLRLTAGEPLPRDLADAICASSIGADAICASSIGADAICASSIGADAIGPNASDEGVRLWNLYGPTETTIYSGGALVLAEEPIEIGSLIGGTRLYLLDDRLRPVPPGVLGEVYIGGAGLAHGYAGAPAQTAERFVPDPFGDRPGARLYRTGDLGRWRPSGRIELAGRADRQFKIRGYRVESGEVEAALRSHPEVAEAVVSVRGGGADVRLVGYLIGPNGAAEPPEDLREQLRRVLPDYMVPAAFVMLDRLPLTASGKVDHRALPEPNWAAGSGTDHTEPRNPVEAQLAAIFAEVLALPQPVGVTDNFFALGGHSLTATQLMNRVHLAYGVDLPLRILFGDPTVAGLAAAVSAARPVLAGERA